MLLIKCLLPIAIPGTLQLLNLVLVAARLLLSLFALSSQLCFHFFHLLRHFLDFLSSDPTILLLLRKILDGELLLLNNAIKAVLLLLILMYLLIHMLCLLNEVLLLLFHVIDFLLLFPDFFMQFDVQDLPLFLLLDRLLHEADLGQDLSVRDLNILFFVLDCFELFL